jgi:CDP-Glycerol:Poly(glycerophosphate) glycerophosphotransferase
VSIKGRLLASAGLAGLNVLAVAAFVVLALTTARTIGYVLAGVSVLGVVLVRAASALMLSAGVAPTGLGTGSGGADQAHDGVAATLAPQLLLAAGLLVAYHSAVPGSTVVVAVTGALVGVVIANQPLLAETINRPTVRATNLPGYRPARSLLLPPPAVYAVGPLLVTLVLVFAAGSVPIWPLAGLAAGAAAVVSVVGVQALRVRLGGVRAEHAFRAVVERFDAAFALHFSGPDNGEYQVATWLPYLERIGRRWILVLREPQAYARLSRTAPADVPVVYCPLLEHVEQVVTPGLRTVFYVNNGMKNSHMVRFGRLTHIQIGHGDSDKASSHNPVTAMFDRIFVAGEAAIDRYAANGVVIPREKFDIVGRPQIESVKVIGGDIRDVTDKVVLYATTWSSHYQDANYSSLPIGAHIVAALLARGATVILRPHPQAGQTAGSARQLARLSQMLDDDRQRTGRAHIFGTAATKQMSLSECMNRSDAMISDVSAAASDFLYSGKPFALTNTVGEPSAEFEASFPLARAAYVIDGNGFIDGSGDTLDAVLDDLLRDDPLAAERLRMRTYYLGDFPPDTYADGFVNAARRYTREPSPRRAVPSNNSGRVYRVGPVTGTDQSEPHPIILSLLRHTSAWRGNTSD